tara:strand:- start:1878 stop:2069 length:192 start_codon:yes stop_codon:yes gene_type:complete
LGIQKRGKTLIRLKKRAKARNIKKKAKQKAFEFGNTKKRENPHQVEKKSKSSNYKKEGEAKSL